MKKVLFIIVLSVSYFSMSCSQSSQAGNPDNIKGAAIEFEETVHDYGTILYGGDGAYEFVFHNKGSEPLLLNNVRSTCGCTTPEWPREPIPAGESGKIKVIYNTRIMGSFSKSVTVYSNASEKPIVLVIKGNVEQAAK